MTNKDKKRPWKVNFVYRRINVLRNMTSNKGQQWRSPCHPQTKDIVISFQTILSRAHSSIRRLLCSTTSSCPSFVLSQICICHVATANLGAVPLCFVIVCCTCHYPHAILQTIVIFMRAAICAFASPFLLFCCLFCTLYGNFEHGSQNFEPLWICS